MKRRHLLPILTIMLVLGSLPHAMAFSLPWKRGDQASQIAPARPVVSVILSQNAAQRPSIPGVIAAQDEVLLAFQTLGRIIARNVDIGDRVSTGQLLAALDPDDLQGNVRAARANVQAAEVEQKTAKAAAERARALARRNVTSTAQLEQAERALASANAALLQAQSELIRAKDAEGFAEMRAPFDGVISAVFANAGAVINAGEPVLQLSSYQGIEAVIDLPDQMMASIRSGDRYEIWSDREPGQVFVARVSQIEPVADAATRTRRLHLVLPDNAPFRLGALIRARPYVPDHDYLTVPRQAIFQRDGKDHVWLVSRPDARETGTVSARPVTIADSSADKTVLVTSGLSSGDEIVIRGTNSLTEGQTVGRSVTP